MTNSFLKKLGSFVKGPGAVLRCILPRLSAGLAYCGVLLGVFHSPGFRFLASGAFYYAVRLDNFIRVLQGRS
jgi:hypothetical protein